MEEQNETGKGTASSQNIPIEEEVTGETVAFGSGFAVRVNAVKDVNMSESGALMISAGQDAKISYGGALAIAAGRDLQQETGGGLAYAAGRDLQLSDSIAVVSVVGANLDMKDSAAIVAVSTNTKLDQSLVGVLISSNTELGEGNRILLTTPQAAALGAAFGLVFAVLSWLFRRK
jgi:hypothetical protein